MILRSLVALSFLVLFVGLADLRAQSVAADWFYRAWQTEDGLPDNSISAVAQSADGYLWVGTNGGAIRFNGTQFSPLPLSNIPKLPSRQVRAMHIDHGGNVWLGMERGPVLRVGENSFRTFDQRDGLTGKLTKSFIDDPLGRLWIAYHNGVFFIENDTVTKLLDFPPAAHTNLVCDLEGQVWLARGAQLGRLSENGFERVRRFQGASLKIATSKKSGLWLTAGSDLIRLAPGDRFTTVAQLPENVVVRILFEDRSGAVWIGTKRAGLLRVEDGHVERVATSHPSVTCINEDREGNIWVGTEGGGLNLIRPRAVRLIDEFAGLPFASVRSSACDASGRIWAVSEDGRLATRDLEAWRLSTAIEEDTLINCVAADSKGGVWLGTRNRGLLRIEGDQLEGFGVEEDLSGSLVRSLLVARNDDVWIATDVPDKLHRLRDGKILPIAHPGEFSAIRGMAETADGTIWAGSSDGRLFRVEGDELIDESGVDGSLARSVRTLHATPDGSLWIGYAGDGIGHLKDGRYKRITTAVGLFDDYVSQIQDDGDGALWIAANRGLFKVGLDDLLTVSTAPNSPDRLRCRVFGSNDGVPSVQPSRDYAPAAGRSPSGSLFFSTHSGIVEVYPDKFSENIVPPPVVFEKVVLDSQVAAIYQPRSLLDATERSTQTNLSLASAHLDIPPSHDKIAIHFAALSLTSPENVTLRYRLSPLDKDWEQIGSQRSVTLPHLPAGDYKFQVIACNNAGVWNETGATLSLAVRPFYWETWPFRIALGLLTALAAGGMVFLALRRKHRRQLQSIAAKQAVEQERSRIARDIHDDLGASLTRITLLSQTEPLSRGEKAEDSVLDQIQTTAQDLMRSMEEVVWAVNPEHDTFDALANYLSNYGQGFLSIAGVRCRLELPMSLPGRPLSAQIRHNLFLAFKEALNNAVKHANATEVRISLDLEDAAFVLKVEDDGEGVDPNATAVPMRPTGGSGLANMKERMDEIGGTCVLHSTLGEGTTVEFRVPFKTDP